MALLDPNALQVICDLVEQLLHLFVGDHSCVLLIVALPIKGHTITMACLNVSVYGIVADVRLCSDEPLD